MAEDISNTKMMPLRIHVGGLGESVAENEVSRIFESVGGVVEGVELVRTKGRSFAYVDFLPSSDKSLSKLFGTYNGCVWKGGRLRLEKAKEHYLLRLRREWAEDSAQVATVDTSEMPNNLKPSEKNQLQFFFPRLRKVKSLPFSGTGKHKYSFQRVEVPSLPKHFCDCEEHSYPSQTEIKKRSRDLEEQSGGMNQEELNIMNAVMNKLFEKQNSSILTHNKTASCNNEENSLKSIDDQDFDDDEADEDNLIINVVRKGNKTESLLGSSEDPKVSENQTWVPGTKEGPLEDVFALQKRNNNQLPNKKQKTLLNDESSGNPYDYTISGGKRNLQTHSNNSGIVMAAQPANPESVIQLSTDRVSWSQKSSWKKLVGDRGNNAFSISRIVPGIPSTVEGQQRSDAPNVPNSNSKNQNLEIDEELNSDSENQNLDGDEELNSNGENQNLESDEELNSDSENQNLESDEELNSDSENQNLESDEELNSNGENQNLESDEELNSDSKNKNLKSDEELNSDSENENLESDEELNSDSENQNSDSDEELNSDSKNQNSDSDEELNFDSKKQNSESDEELNFDSKKQNSESDEELNSDSKNQNSESDEELNTDSKNQNLESDEELNSNRENQNSESNEELKSNSENQNSERDEELNSDTKNQNLESDKELDTDTKIQNMQSYEELEGKLEGGEGLIEAQPTEPVVVSSLSTQSGRGIAWRKKSSWTQLVNNTNSSFSISQLLPGINFEQQIQVEPKGVEVASSTNGKPNKIVKQDSDSVKDGSAASGIGKEGDISVSPPHENQKTVLAKNEPSGSVSQEKYSPAQKQTSARSVEMGETCSFMRNATSLKEWAKTKAALNGSLKRKRTEK